MLDREISLIISDQQMPGMTGTEFLSRCKAISPNSVRMLLTVAPHAVGRAGRGEARKRPRSGAWHRLATDRFC
jgi:response regulator RpfG family c-di-GMP phosphodiesterase